MEEIEVEVAVIDPRLVPTDKDPLWTGWCNAPTYKDLKADYDAAETSHSEYVSRLEINRLNLQGGKAVKARTGKSKHRPLVIRKNAEWKYPMLSEPLLNTEDMYKIRSRTAEDKAAAEQNETLLNYYMSVTTDKVQLVDEATRTFTDEGTVIIKTGWYSEEEEVEVEKEFPVYASAEESLMMLQQAVQSGQMPPEQAQAMLQSGEPVQTGTEIKLVPEMRLVENHPLYTVCQNENIILDPTCDGVKENLKFLIHEYETDISTLRDQEYIREYIKLSDGTEEVREVGMYHNLDKINLDADEELTYSNNYKKKNDDEFQFSDDARKKLIAYEYWGEWDVHGDGSTEAIVGTWIDNVLIRLELNPFPHKEIPFSIAAYMPIQGELRGQPDGELLIENQDMIGKMMRAANDITSTNAIGQKLVNEQLFSNSSEWDSFEAGNDARYQANLDPKSAIYQMNVEKVDPSVFQMIELYTADAEQMTGTRGANGGGGSSGAYQNQASVRSSLDASAKRELGILRRFVNQAFNDMGRKTISNQQVFASTEETLRITSGDYITIRREELAGQFDLIIDVSTPEAEAAKAEQLMKMMQTNQANMDPGLQKIFYTDLLRLWKMPEAEKAVEEYEPQPDPAAEEMKRMQLENAKLENQKLQMEIATLAKGVEDTDSKIVERVSRAEENMTADIDVKKSQAESFRAQAEKLLAEAAKLESETDAIDNDFLETRDGTARERDELDAEFDAANRKEEISLKGRIDGLNSTKGGDQ